MFLHLLASTTLFSWPLGIVTYDNVSFEEDGLNVALETCVDADPFLKSSVVYDEDAVKKLPSLETKSGVETGLLKNLGEHNKREITQKSNWKLARQNHNYVVLLVPQWTCYFSRQSKSAYLIFLLFSLPFIWPTLSTGHVWLKLINWWLKYVIHPMQKFKHEFWSQTCISLAAT